MPPGYRERERLDVYLTAKVTNATRAKVQASIREGRVDVNGTTETRVSRPVSAGDVLVCRVRRPPPLDILPEALPLTVVYEDDALLVVDKAAGMVVHPAYGHRSGTLVNALLHFVGAGAIHIDESSADDGADEGETSAEDEDAPTGGLSAMTPVDIGDGTRTARPGIVHRIDKDTSGLLVVAKTDLSHARLAAQFADHSIQREYMALVWGVPTPGEQTVETELGRDLRDRKKVAVVKAGTGKRAITHLRVVESFGDAALVAFHLETGRTHQIRVHARHIGHALIGDATYGGAEVPRRIVGSRRAMFQNVLATLNRQALHAHLLGVRHPDGGAHVDWRSPLPADMADALARLRRATAGIAADGNAPNLPGTDNYGTDGRDGDITA